MLVNSMITLFLCVQYKRSTRGSDQRERNYYSGEQSSPASNQLRQDGESGFEGYEIPVPRYYYPIDVDATIATHRDTRDSEINERDDNTDEQQRTYDYPADVRQAEEEPIYDSAGGSGRSSQRTASYVEILNGQQHYNNMAVSVDFPNSSIFSN